MKRLIQIAVIVLAGMLCGTLDAQTNTPTVTVTIAPLKVAAVASVTPTALGVPPGTSGTLTYTVAAPSGSTTVPTGKVELLGKDPSTGAWLLVNTFTLVNGQATCTYPVPSTTPAGTYTVELAYGGDTNYLASKDYQ